MKALDIRVVPIGDVKPYELNSKKHDPEQVKRIAESIKQFGWDQPIVVDKSNVIIKGHGRRLAAIELGLTQIPVLVRSDLSEEQVRAARLADNRVALSDIDTELLRQELATLTYDLVGIFDEKELDYSLADLGEINVDAFIDDVDAAVNAQEAATKEKIKALEERRIPIAQALGVKDIKGADENLASRFMSSIEETTGLKGEEAFLKHMKSVVEE